MGPSQEGCRAAKFKALMYPFFHSSMLCSDLIRDLLVFGSQRAKREQPHAGDAAVVVDLVVRERLGVFLGVTAQQPPQANGM